MRKMRRMMIRFGLGQGGMEGGEGWRCRIGSWKEK